MDTPPPQVHDHYYHTTTAYPPSPFGLTKSSTTSVHTDTHTVKSTILQNLTDLLPDSTTNPNNHPGRHVFECLVLQGKSASGKPRRAKCLFSLQLDVKPTSPEAENESVTEITISTVTDSLSPSPVPISGVIKLSAAPHGTTQLTLSLTLEGGIASTSSAGSFIPRAKTLGNARAVVGLSSASPSPPNSNALDHLLSLVPILHSRFARYDVIDRLRYTAFSSHISRPFPIQPHEDLLVTASAAAMAATGTWKCIAGSVREPVEYFHKTADNATWGKAVATVDASATSVLAYQRTLSSYRTMQNHIKSEGAAALWRVVDVPNSRSLFYVNMVRLGLGVSHRVFGTWFSWREEADGSFLLAFAPLDEYAAEALSEKSKALERISERRIELKARRDRAGTSSDANVFARDMTEVQGMIDGLDDVTSKDADGARERKERVQTLNGIITNDPLAAKAIRGTSRGCWRFRPLAPSVCEVTYVVCVQLGGVIPKELLALRKKRTLAVVQRIQDMFERNGRVVDAEMRAAFPSPPPLADLNDEQKAIVESCQAMETREDGVWETLSSPSPFVDMWCKKMPAKRGQRSIALGKATAVLDCSARDALACFFAVVSRENLRISSEQGHPARLVQRRTGSNDAVVATIKKMPFPLKNREFVNRQVAATDTNGDFLVVTAPTNEVIDYGMKTNTVRGVARFLMRLMPEGHEQCKVTYHMYLDAGGRIPTFVVNGKISLALGAVGELREEFQRDDEIDQVKQDELARIIKEEPQTYTADEDILVNRVHVKLGMLEWEHFEELESPDQFVKMGKIFTEGSHSVVIRASVTIDATAEQCAAWEMCHTSRERMRDYGTLPRSLTNINDHSGVYHMAIDSNIPGLQPREFLSSLVWRRQGDEFTAAYEPTDRPDFPLNPSWVRGTSTVHAVYRNLQAVEGIPQSRLTWTQQVDIGGVIPKFVANGQTVNQLMYLSAMRKNFDKSLDIEGTTRAQNVEIITSHATAYSSEEELALEDGMQLFADFNDLPSKSVTMASPEKKVAVEIEDGVWGGWSWATATVRANPEEVLARVWDQTKRSLKYANVETFIEERPNAHSQLVYVEIATPKIIADRALLARMLWKKTNDGYIFVLRPEESAARPTQEGGFVRVILSMTIKLTRKNDTTTTFQYASHAEYGGREVMPFFLRKTGAILVNRALGRNMERATNSVEFFQALRGVEAWDADDGRIVGEILCTKTAAEKQREKGESKVEARMRAHFSKFQGLSEISKKHEFFRPMITRVVENKLRTAGDVKSKLCSLSVKEGRTIGAGLALAMATNLTAEVGVDGWILKHKALQEFDLAEAWFRPMMNAVTKKLLGQVSWGLKMRVIMGAGLSVIDMATDIFVIVGYMGKEGTKGYGWSLLGMIGACMALQLIIVFLQHRKRPLKMLGEMVIVLTGLKPGFDAFNVCSGKAMGEYSVFDAKEEMVFTKGIEMICESIPGCVLQMFAILKSGDRSRPAIASIAVSALTTGFSSSSISFDFDVDPQARKEAPKFYGYIPDGGGRTVIFGCMLLNSSLLLLVRSFSAAMLMLVNMRYFLLCMAGDMALYLLLKVARGDFHYWVPVDGALGLVFSLVARVIVKTITDFTGVIQMRHPGELGGLYWTVNMFLALLVSFVSVWVYFQNGGEEVNEREALTLVGCMSGAWLITFLLFLLVMKKGYRRTFFASKTGKQNTQNYFLLGADDSVKSIVVKNNKKQWKDIREDVKEWVQANYWRWDEERPAWFTDAWLSKVPPSFIPSEGRGAAKEIRASARRRSNFALVAQEDEEKTSSVLPVVA